MPPQVQLPQWHLDNLECTITSRMSTLIGKDTQCVHNQKRTYVWLYRYIYFLFIPSPPKPLATSCNHEDEHLFLPRSAKQGAINLLLGISHNLYDFQVSILSSIFFLCLILHLLSNIQTCESRKLYAIASFSYQLPSICSYQQQHK